MWDDEVVRMVDDADDADDADEARGARESLLISGFGVMLVLLLGVSVGVFVRCGNLFVYMLVWLKM